MEDGASPSVGSAMRCASPGGSGERSPGPVTDARVRSVGAWTALEGILKEASEEVRQFRRRVGDQRLFARRDGEGVIFLDDDWPRREVAALVFGSTRERERLRSKPICERRGRRASEEARALLSEGGARLQASRDLKRQKKELSKFLLMHVYTVGAHSYTDRRALQ